MAQYISDDKKQEIIRQVREDACKVSDLAREYSVSAKSIYTKPCNQWFADHGISYVNVDSDLDIPFLRMIKLATGPDHYFRYHSIEPA